jgi:hypothetical protein
LATWSFEFESGSLQTSEQVRAGQQSFPEKLEGSLTALAIVRTKTGPRANRRACCCLSPQPSGTRSQAIEQDPEKCVAVFRKDHAQTKSQSAMTIQPNLIAL